MFFCKKYSKHVTSTLSSLSMRLSPCTKEKYCKYELILQIFLGTTSHDIYWEKSVLDSGRMYIYLCKHKMRKIRRTQHMHVLHSDFSNGFESLLLLVRQENGSESEQENYKQSSKSRRIKKDKSQHDPYYLSFLNIFIVHTCKI